MPVALGGSTLQLQASRQAVLWPTRNLSRVFSLRASLLACCQQKRNEVFQIFFRKTLCVIRPHQGLARFLERPQFGLLKRVQLLARVQHLNGKAVFVQHHSMQLYPLGCHHRRSLIFLRKVLHRLGQPCRQPLTRTAHRLRKIFEGPGCPGGTEICTQSAAFALHHVAGSTGCAAVEECLPMRCISRLCRGSLLLHAADVGNHLPDFLVRHAHPDSSIRCRRHGGACDPFVNVVKDFSVGIAVMFLCVREVRAASSSPRSQAMAESAVQPELVFTQLRHSRVPGKWIFLLRAQRRCCGPEKHRRDRSGNHRPPPLPVTEEFREGSASRFTHIFGDARSVGGFASHAKSPFMNSQQSWISATIPSAAAKKSDARPYASLLTAPAN